MLDVLYSMVGVIIAAAYLPQAMKLAKNTSACYDVSVVSWILWAYTSSITFLYTLYRLETFDLMLVSINAINMVCISTIVCITLYKRWKYRTPRTPLTILDEPVDNVQMDSGHPAEYTIDNNINKTPLS